MLFGALVLLVQGLARVVRQGHDETRTAQVLGLTSSDATISELAVPAAIVVLVAVGRGGSRRCALLPVPGRSLSGTRTRSGRRCGRDDARGRCRRADARADGDLRDRFAPPGPPRPAGPSPDRGPDLGDGDVAGSGRSAATTGVRGSIHRRAGSGRTYVPTRLVLVSSVVTVALLIATLVFGENLSSLARDPERFGWEGDGLVMMDGGYGRIDPDASAPWLETQDDLEGWRLVGADRTLVNGREVAGVVYGPDGGSGSGTRAGPRVRPFSPPGRRGRRGSSDAERSRRRDRGLGDTGRRRAGPAGHRHRCGGVRRARSRAGDPDPASTTGSGPIPTTPTRSRRSPPTAGRTTCCSSICEALASTKRSPVRRERRRVSDRVSPAGTVDSYGVLRPAEVESASSAGRVQSALVAVVVVVAVLSLFFTLVAVVRRRRRDLSILSALGFTPAQLRTTMIVAGVAVRTRWGPTRDAARTSSSAAALDGVRPHPRDRGRSGRCPGV